MQIIRISRNDWKVKITEDDKDKIKFIARELKDVVDDLKPYEYWKSMKSEKIWEHIIIQFCVMGSALRIEKLKKDKENYQDFLRKLSIKNLIMQSTSRTQYISDQLKKYKATRFTDKTAERIVKCLKNQGIVKNGKVVLLEDLKSSTEISEDQIRATLLERCRFFQMKSVSDFMISIGAAKNFIALDTRIIGLFKKHFHLNGDVKPTSIQSNRSLYKAIEKELVDICADIGINLSTLDRILFKSSGISAIDYVMEKKYKIGQNIQ